MVVTGKSKTFLEMILLIVVLLADPTQSSSNSKSSSDVYKKLGKAIQSKSADKSLALLDKHYFTRKKGMKLMIFLYPLDYILSN